MSDCFWKQDSEAVGMLTGIHFIIVVTGTLTEELVFVTRAELDPEAHSLVVLAARC